MTLLSPVSKLTTEAIINMVSEDFVSTNSNDFQDLYNLKHENCSTVWQKPVVYIFRIFWQTKQIVSTMYKDQVRGYITLGLHTEQEVDMCTQINNRCNLMISP